MNPFFHRILFGPLHCTLYSQPYRHPLYPYRSLYLLNRVILLTYSFYRFGIYVPRSILALYTSYGLRTLYH